MSYSSVFRYGFTVKKSARCSRDRQAYRIVSSISASVSVGKPSMKNPRLKMRFSASSSMFRETRSRSRFFLIIRGSRGDDVSTATETSPTPTCLSSLIDSSRNMSTLTALGKESTGCRPRSRSRPRIE